MKKKTLYTIIGIVLVVIILLVVGKKSGWFGKSGNYKSVEITKLENIDIVETVSATGKIQPETEVKLSSEVSGEIIELPVVEGQQVKEGELLVRVNPNIYESNLAQANASLMNIKSSLAQSEAGLTQAKSNYERNKGLFEKGIISKSEWDEIVSAYESATAARQAAYYNVKSGVARVSESQENLGRTTIYAPMTGTISSLSTELGERVVGTQQMAGTEIMRVANLANMEVVVDVNENDIVKVEIGDSAIVEVDAYLKQQFGGKVTEISNSATSDLTADQVTNFKVKVKILKDSYAHLTEGKPESYSPFRPGMTATVDIVTNKKENVLAVPISAIVIKSDTTASSQNKRDDGSYEAVFVKKDEKAALQKIKTGIQDNTNIEVIQGLEVGDKVITGPYSTVTKSLKDGDKVEVTETEDLKSNK